MDDTSKARPQSWKWVLIGLVLGLVLCTGAGVWYAYYQVTEFWAITDLHETDFKSDTERINLIAGFTRLPVPAEASQITLHFTGWKDYHLDCRFVLPPAQYDAFVKTLKKKEDKSDPAAYEVNPTQYIYGSIHVDDVSRSITIEAFSI